MSAENAKKYSIELYVTNGDIGAFYILPHEMYSGPLVKLREGKGKFSNLISFLSTTLNNLPDGMEEPEKIKYVEITTPPQEVGWKKPLAPLEIANVRRALKRRNPSIEFS